MPQYPYVCRKCKKYFEDFKQISVYDGNTTCPHCDESNTEDDRQFPSDSAPKFNLDGDDWPSKRIAKDGVMEKIKGS